MGKTKERRLKEKTPPPPEPKKPQLDLVDGKYPIVELSDVDIAFPATVKYLMPAYDARAPYGWGDTFASKVFFRGLPKKIFDQLVAKEGVDKTKAMRHLRAILGSYEPKHEHKTQAVGKLLENWFEQPTFDLDWEG